MVKRTSHKEAGCPVARPLDAIGDWWSLLIIRDAFEGLRRFGEFQRSLGLARNILSARLRNWWSTASGHCAGIRWQRLSRVPADREGARPVPGAGGAAPVGRDYCFGADRPAVRLLDREHAQPVRHTELRAQDGRLLGPDDTVVVKDVPA